MQELITEAMNCLGVAVTILDSEGILLYYNRRAAQILDRKPEYIGSDIYGCHKKATSNDKIRSMLRAFQDGRTLSYHYRATPYGQNVFVTVAPILEDGQLKGIVQSVLPMKEMTI